MSTAPLRSRGMMLSNVTFFGMNLRPSVVASALPRSASKPMIVVWLAARDSSGG